MKTCNGGYCSYKTEGSSSLERFDIELQKVLGVGKYAIDAQAKLAPLKSHPGRVFLGRDSKTGNELGSEKEFSGR